MTKKPDAPTVSATISQSNELTEAAYYLPLQAKRVLWMCLVQMFKKKNPEQESPQLFTVLVSEYQRLFNVNKGTASRDMKNGITSLANSSVIFKPKDNEFDEVMRPWLAEAGVKAARGKWVIEFNSKIIPFMHGLTSQFTTYNLLDVGRLNSPRAIRLYESLVQFRNTGIWVVKVSEMADRFLLPDYQRSNTAAMKRAFLTPALKKINETTPLSADFTLDENGKLIFTIIDKTKK